MSLQTNLKMIKLLLDDIRSGAKYNSNDTRSMRYIFCNVYNAATHERLGIDKDIDSPDFAYMSEAFKEKWESLGKPSGGDALKKFGIHEHAVPMSILVQKMVEECTDERSIYEFLSKHNRIVFLTKEEDKMLNEAGYQRVMPADGGRYSAVGIKVHPEPIVYKNYAKHRGARNAK